MIWMQKKQEREKIFETKYHIKKPVYGNCSILSPDGLKLCNCDQQKIKWYLSKGLADLVSE